MATSKATDAPPVQHVIQHEAPPALELLLEKHGKKILVVLLLGIVGICVAFVMRALHAEKLVEASQAFTDAETIADFENVAEEREGTPAGGSALLMLAARHQNFGKLDDARIALLRFTKEYPKHPRYHQGLFDLALISGQLDQKEEASKYLAEVAASESELAPLAILRQAEDAAAAGDLKAALETMKGIASRHPGSPFIEHIDSRIEALGHRILLAENPPPAPEPEPEPEPVTPTTPENPASPLLPTPGAPNATPPVIEIPATPTAPETTPEAVPGPAETPESPIAPEAPATPPSAETPAPASPAAEDAAPPAIPE